MEASGQDHSLPPTVAPSSVCSAPSSPGTPSSSIEGLSDDVAIVGMACRTSGGNTTPEKLWQFLLDKKDASGHSPSWRWEPWARRDPRNAKVIEKTISKGYFIPDLENFDAAFFGISPKEAEQMDPHQRLGLEVTWEALESAGIDPKSLSGSDTAVYMGVDSDDYSRLLLEDIPNIEAWMGIGTTAHGIPNRISYHLDLMGPSAAVDAACASSLCAVHIGRQAVLNGDSRVAIVGGVNVCLSPALFHMLGSAGALSPDGVCLSFDDDACGYARGEGAAVLVLKRLSHALVDGDHILATLKGTAVAQDGKTNGIMAPNAKAQELVARKALQAAGVDPLSVGYIEAHATSTKLGDPTEVSAISAVYGAGRPSGAPAFIGSIKPNIGHLEAAAGAISLIKAVMAVNKAEIPPQTRLTKLNTKVDWARSGLRVVQDKIAWDDSDGPRRAAICSYGYGGTVAHAIIEQSSVPARVPAPDAAPPAATLLVLSAPQEKRLPLQSAAQADWLATDGARADLQAVASTLAQHRASHDFRAAFVVADHAEAARTLGSFAKGLTVDWSAQGRRFGGEMSKELVWVFSGHGAQWADMGKELLLNAVFARAVAPLDSIVSQELGYSAIESMREGNLGTSEEVQVLTYLVQVGLSQVLKSKGIQPSAIIGHSVGEIAASVAAGCLTPEEGALLVTRRAGLYTRVRGLGGMSLVSLPFAEVAAELGDRTDIVAAIDASPSSCVVSGATTPLAEYVEALQRRGVRCFQVKTDIGFHSPMLEALATPLEEALSGALEPRRPTARLYSTSLADARSQDARDAKYWVNNMVRPVWLTSAVGAAVDDGYRTFLEVSSHPIVSHSINEILLEKNIKEFAVIPTMKKDQPAERSILHAVAQLYVTGAPVDFSAFLGRQWCSDVPGFVWSQKPFWKEVSTAAAAAESLHDVDKHTMLGQRTVVAGTNTTLYSTTLDVDNKPFPRPHELHGTNIIPAAVYVNTFFHATGAKTISQVTLRSPLAITDDPRNVQVVVENDSVKVSSRLRSSDDKAWVTHSAAKWSAEPLPPPAMPLDVDAVKKRIGRVLPNNYSVDYLARVGVAGIAFPWAVTEHYGNAQEMMVRVDTDPDHEDVPWDPSSWAPVLDAASSVGATIFADDAKLRIVSKIDKALLHTEQVPPKTCYLHVTERQAAADDAMSRSADVSVLDIRGALLAQFQGLTLTEVNGPRSVSQSMEGLVHQLAWVPPPLAEKPLEVDQVVLLSENSEILDRYESDLDGKFPKVVKVSSVPGLGEEALSSILSGLHSAVVYCPGPVGPSGDIAASAQKFIWEVAKAVRVIVRSAFAAKFFIVTDSVFAAASATALAQGPLYGLARVVALEHSDIWGGLIDNEGPRFPLLPFKYVHGRDIIRLVDGVPRVARMRPFTKEQLLPASSPRTLLPKPEGTYLITGGLGVLGLETCDFLIEKGARRIVIVSRRALPPRGQWAAAPVSLAPILRRITAMENRGASIHVVPLDIGSAEAHNQLLGALERLSLPPVKGVIHASGILEDSLLLETTEDSFARVLAPKISGALALHRAFPPAAAELDFFVLYSSIGQLVGTSGQSSYGSGNAFLDTLAAHRRRQGDNAIAFQWTAWQGLGMGTSAFLALELESKGITDITRREGFAAWEHMCRYDVEQVVVTRHRALDEGDPVPCPLLEDIVIRRPRRQDDAPSSSPLSSTLTPSGAEAAKGEARPTETAALRGWLSATIRTCLGSILKIDDIEDIDDRVALADIGVDSVMTIVLRQKLQGTLKVKVPQTLIWNHPTVVAMVDWFVKQFQDEAGKV